MQFVAVVNDADGGMGKLALLQAVYQLLQERGRAFRSDDEVSRQIQIGDQRVGHLGGTGGLGFFQRFIGLYGRSLYLISRGVGRNAQRFSVERV